MNRTPVQSSNVVSVGYEGTTLEVEFKSGLYRYSDVPADVHTAFMASNSKGQFVGQHLRNKYPTEKVVA